MCGIAGYYRPDQPADEAGIQAMIGPIVHRGPDDSGIHLDKGCALGMRRLSIIDLATGHQPIGNEDGTVWVVFNGEIYNHRELRTFLEGRGHRFHTHSDTEVLVHLYEEEGAEGIQRLRGMFAYAIWDQRRRQLLLVRDRFGKKPLYYALVPGGVYFASELKCFRGLGLDWDVDADALRLYFQFFYIPDPYSPFRGVRKLAPGTWLAFDAAGAVRHGRYWRLPEPAEEPPPGLTPEEACGQLRELFDEAVRIRMLADVPLGAFLSGGIDSGSVVASMARQSSQPVKTFSIGFEEAGFNELDDARRLAARYRTEHHEAVVKPDSVVLLERLARHFDEPFGDASAIPTYIVSDLAARHVKVALTGDGGDELFAGYGSFFAVEKMRRWDRAPAPLRRVAGWTGSLLPYSAYGKNLLRVLGRTSPLERYFESIYVPFELRRRLLAPEWMLPAGGAFLRRAFPDSLLPGERDELAQALYFEATAKLTGDMLVKVDRMSMAASLEVRCPMLDHRLAEFAARLPAAWKMAGGRGKAILIDALGDRLPPGHLTAPKRGFGVPLADWFRGPLRQLLRDYLATASIARRGIVLPAFVQYLMEEHERGRRDNSYYLYPLLMLELWFRDWEREPHFRMGVKNPPPAA